MKVYKGTSPSSIILFLAMFSLCISLISSGVSSILEFLFFAIFILLLSYTVILKIKEEKIKQDEYKQFPKIRTRKFILFLIANLASIIIFTTLLIHTLLTSDSEGIIIGGTLAFLGLSFSIIGLIVETKDFNNFRNKIAILALSSKPDDASSD